MHIQRCIYTCIWMLLKVEVLQQKADCFFGCFCPFLSLSRKWRPSHASFCGMEERSSFPLGSDSVPPTRSCCFITWSGRCSRLRCRPFSFLSSTCSRPIPGACQVCNWYRWNTKQSHSCFRKITQEQPFPRALRPGLRLQTIGSFFIDIQYIFL